MKAMKAQKAMKKKTMKTMKKPIDPIDDYNIAKLGESYALWNLKNAEIDTKKAELHEEKTRVTHRYAHETVCTKWHELKPAQQKNVQKAEASKT